MEPERPGLPGLEYLLTSHWARLLAGAWPRTEFAAGDDDGMYLAWSRASGVPLDLSEKIGTQLLESGVCLPDGQLAEGVAEMLAAGLEEEDK